MTLTMRLLTILFAGFVVVQALFWAFMALPSEGDGGRPYNLPRPAELALIVESLESAPPPRQAALLSLFNSSTYTMRLRDTLPARPMRDREGLGALQAEYRRALGGRWVAIATRRPRIGWLAGDAPWPLRFFAPIRVSVPMRDGQFLTVVTRPSPVLRDYLRQRAATAAVLGLAILLALGLAVRQATQPLARLARGVEAFAEDLAARDLPERGPRELRALTHALNAMKARIRTLLADRTRMLADIAHDLRTYLTRLRLRAEYIEDEGQRARAVADLDEMAMLLEDTLLFARDESQSGPAIRYDAAGELARLVADRQEAGDAVVLAAAPPSAWLLGMPLDFRRMLRNLIDNGLRHGVRVAVSAAGEAGSLAVCVRDDGPGVPESALPLLGEPFRRLDPARDRGTGGAGLGLAIVRALAARSGGTVTFRNLDGGGFEARLTLPMEAAPPA